MGEIPGTMVRVGIDLGEAVDVPEAPATSLPDVGDYVDFAAAGSDVAGEFRCGDCGYGAVVQKVLPPCPMCRGTVWERRAPAATHFDV